MSFSSNLQGGIQPEDGLQQKEASKGPDDDDNLDKHYVEGFRLFLVMTGLILCLFLPSLDQLIISMLAGCFRSLYFLT